MKFQKWKMTMLLNCIASATLLICSTGVAQEQKADPSGNWIWIAPGRNGGPDRTNVLTLKVEDSKLTGKISAPGRDGQPATTPIINAKVDGENISFTIVREFNGNATTNKHSGKVSADKITGKIEFTRNGDRQSRDWEARRSNENK